MGPNKRRQFTWFGVDSHRILLNARAKPEAERRIILKTLPKVAICHEWLDNIGGGEKVLFELANIFENPTIYTLWTNKETVGNLDFKIKTSFLQYFPSRFRRSLGLLLMPLAWRTFERELQTFDLVINSSWAFAHSAGGNHPQKISYIHTPGRYWWYPSIDQRTQIRIPKVLLKLIRHLDYRLAQKSNIYIANSEETRKRIEDCWGKNSELIYPPVDLDFYGQVDFAGESESFILGVGRFVGYKNHEFIISLGEALGIKVVLAGHGPLGDLLKNQAKKSRTEVKVLDSPTNSDLRELYSRAICLVYPAVEDFGIVPVEAMGCGLQVLGLSQGGLLETVESDLSGTLVETMDITKFIQGFYELPNKPKVDIKKSVDRFSTRHFKEKIIQRVERME